MEKEPLLQELERISRVFNFVPTDDPPYLVRLGENDYRELKQNGHYFNRAATVEITDSKHLPADEDWQSELRRKYNELAMPLAVRLPEIISAGGGRTNSDFFFYRILERPEGEMIISFDDLKKPFLLGDKVYQKIVEMVRVHWETRETLDRLAQENPEAAVRIGKSSWTKYFEGQFDKWSEEVKKADTGQDYILPEMLSKIKDQIFDLHPSKMQLSFNLFGNTDIRKTNNGEYYLVNGRFDIKPPGFLAAAWLWNMAMWGWQKSRDDLIRDVFCALRVFLNVPYEVSHSREYILANLLERCYAAINVDIRHKRAPFNDLSGAETGNGLMNFLELTNRILDLGVIT